MEHGCANGPGGETHGQGCKDIGNGDRDAGSAKAIGGRESGNARGLVIIEVFHTEGQNVGGDPK